MRVCPGAFRWRGLSLVWFLILGACGSVEKPWKSGSPVRDPYAQLNPYEVEQLRKAVRSFEAGAIAESLPIFEGLVAQAPLDLPAAVWHQEARLAWRQGRADRFGTPTEEPQGPQADMRDAYRLVADNQPSPLAYYLAARLEDDGLAANLLLERALELDPSMVWAHYGLAYGAAQEGDWIRAREELELVFELDPGHLPALRLFGWLQAEAGDLPSAIAALEAWLDQADRDLLAGQETLDRVRYDLALAYNNDGKGARALEVLEELEGRSIPPVRLLTARAVVQQGRGEIVAARGSALAGRRADRDALLPAVQNALLVELWPKDTKAARRAWKEVIQLAESSDDLAASLQQFRAEVHLQRLERAAAAAGELP